MTDDDENKRLQGCESEQDVTVSKLSKLQKQILVHARKAMLAKGQTIEEPARVTLWVPAPDWLARAIVDAMAAIFKSRQTYQLGKTDMLDADVYTRFFEEIIFLRRTIIEAADKAGKKLNVFDIDPNKLYELCHDFRFALLMAFGIHGKKSFVHPWPHFNSSGCEFAVDIEGMTVEEIKDAIGDKVKNIQVTRDKIYPVNSTTPELLRDIFGFPVQEGGHIAALAFCVEEIGKRRYNSAQASIRRACNRLEKRKLIKLRAGQSSPFFASYYERTGVRITEEGIIVADGLIRPPRETVVVQPTFLESEMEMANGEKPSCGFV